MTKIRPRKILVGGFAVAAALVMLGSSASACVVFRGDLTVTGPTSGNLVTGDGSGTSHLYCSGRAPTTAAAAGRGQSITVTVALATACIGASNKLDAGSNSVIINNAKTDADVPFSYDGAKWVFKSGTGCFRSPAPAGNKTLSTSFAVDATGGGSASYTLPAMNRVDPSNKASAVCVGKAGVSGIFAPIRITSI